MLDVLIIGGGPIGMACGIEAQKRGLSYRIVEKGLLVNSLYHYPLNMTFFSTSDKLEIGDVPFVSHNAKPTRAEAIEYYRRVAMKFDLDIGLYEPVEDISPQTEAYQVKTARKTYKAANVVLATGFYDEENKLNIPGEDLPKVRHYYDDPHPYFRQRLVVVGARNSAVDAALETWRKGAQEVTMVVRESEISQRVKYWARPDIVNRIEEGSIKAYFEAELTAVEPDKVVVEQQGKSFALENDFVLALTGYRPNFDMLRKLGVELDAENSMIPAYNPDTMESNVEGLYLAGVVCGGLETQKWFIENSRAHAPLIMQAIEQRKGAAVKV
ncbi:MAG: YpdA family putative bacillithiol disulfide reductase [Schleiferiaceae bacterium]|nr:YpdA family putative bacillithiol disulfide reductase [Schleiferiaceae bacterium]MDR9441606.1 YpdA family putative bacillithiol disulfide reductase [Schleiferiaceae bacterium]